MSNFNINNFRSEVLSRDLARPSKFEVRIYAPPILTAFANQASVVSLFCDSANLPGMNISTRAYRIYGPAYQRPVSSDFGGDGTTMVFNIDSDMKVKKFFDAWMQNIVNPKTFNVNYSRTYTSNRIDIIQLDKNDKETYSISLIDAFPRSMNLLDLNASSTNQTHKLTVTFAYRKWIANNPFSNFNTEEVAARRDQFAAGALPTVVSKTNSFGGQQSSIDLLSQIKDATRNLASGTTTAVNSAIDAIRNNTK